jgi:hypothetical protein
MDQYPESIALHAPDMALIVKAASYSIEAVIVDSPDVYRLVADDRKTVVTTLRQLEEMRVYQKAPVLEAGRRIDAFFRLPIEQCANTIRLIDKGLNDFERIERDKKAAAERIAAAEADERRRALADEAAKHRTAGNEYVASQIEAVAQTVAQPVAVASAVPVVAGLSTRQLWECEIKDKAAAVAWLMANNFSHLVSIHENGLVALGRSSQGEMKIPGVEFSQAPSKSQRR